jgi:hypothetical protein
VLPRLGGASAREVEALLAEARLAQEL